MSHRKNSCFVAGEIKHLFIWHCSTQFIWVPTDKADTVFRFYFCLIAEIINFNSSYVYKTTIHQALYLVLYEHNYKSSQYPSKIVLTICIKKINREVTCPRSHVRSSKPQFWPESKVPDLFRFHDIVTQTA